MPLSPGQTLSHYRITAAIGAGGMGEVYRATDTKLGRDVALKVLDFGLAKALLGDETPRSSADLSQSPTLEQQGTKVGVILGTAAYMSPEQARGKVVDKRADIRAFGVLVFEMLAGRQLFSGETISDTLAAVLRQEVDWQLLPAETHRSLRRLLKRCLERDPSLRLRDIGEARIALVAPDKTLPADSAGDGRPSPARRRLLWLALAAGTLLIGVALGSLSPWRRNDPQGPPERPGRTLVLPATGRTLGDSQAISPDGRWVAYTAGGFLWIRDLGGIEPREVPDSAGCVRPFWSPGSDAVAFAAGNGIFKVSLEGGRPMELCRFSGGDFTGGSWSASQGLVFTSSRANWDGDVLRVPEGGGAPEPFTRADPAKGERRLHGPHFLPDGKSLLFTVVTRDANDGDIAIDRDGERTLLGLGNGASGPAYSPTGHLVFTRESGAERSLWALPFSLQTHTSTGQAFRVAVGGAGASVSSDGTLVYGLHRPDPGQLVWVDRSGTFLGAVSESIRSTLQNPAVSPDGHRVAAEIEGNRIAVWDTERGVMTRVTDESGAPNWLPGGLEIAYILMGGGEGLRVVRADGSGEPRVLLERRGVAGPNISSDGSFVAFYVVDPETGRDLWAMPADEPDKAFVLLRTPANEAHPRISPDGRFVAYQSDASGRWEVHVQPFPRGEGRWQISVDGGQNPRWSPGGGELYFVSGNELMAAEVAMTPQFRAGRPHRLFSGGDVGTRPRAAAAARE